MLGLLLSLALAAGAQEYGAKGLFPVYETGGQWLIFDKKPESGRGKLDLGSRFLLIGSEGSEVFIVARSSATYGGGCRAKKPAKLPAALLRGPRSKTGRPILGISVPASFTTKSSRARFSALKNEVGEDVYQRLGAAIKTANLDDARSGAFALKEGDTPDKPLVTKIDFASRLEVRGLAAPLFLVEGTQIGGSFRRCLRLADGEKLIGGCVRMHHELMAETALLQFVSYDPGGQGNPYLLAFTSEEPLWGHERWGFIMRADGPRLFLLDAMDQRCRSSF
jgi:hypothetical protein